MKAVAHRFRQSGVLVWFLDQDLRKSAEYLTNDALARTIDGCFAVMCTALLYFAGVRNKKAYAYRFRREARDETMERFFPSWPFRRPPQLRHYSSRTAKWARMCGEHFRYVMSYFEALLDEHEYRTGRRHPLAAFAEWAGTCSARIPDAHIKKVYLPWKCLKLKYRRRDVIEGYRLQYADEFLWGDPLRAYAGVDRDVPEFVTRMFHLDTASMVS